MYCKGLNSTVIQHATVWVNGNAVPRQDWFWREAVQMSEISHLSIHMSKLKPGSYSFELDLMNFGRIPCPHKFTVLQSVANDESDKPDINNSSKYYLLVYNYC